MSSLMNIDDVRLFVKDWNSKYPIDRWWREKYSIPFGSPQHLNQSLLDMRIAFEEDCLHRNLDIEDAEKNDPDRVKYQPGRGAWIKKQPKFTKMTTEDVDDAFNRLAADIDSLKNIEFERGENGKQKIRI